jgi:pimeloyl-ACP methyl ester carboxylesterase
MSSDRGAGRWTNCGCLPVLGLLGALLGGCTFVPPPTWPCPPLPASSLPTAGLALPDVEADELATNGAGVLHGSLVGGDEHLRFHLRETDGTRPLVLMVPILAGGEDLMDQVGNRLVARGYDVASCARAGRALQTGHRAPDLDELFARTVLHQRLLLRWLRARDAAPRPYFVLGISLGGMVAAVLGALEPDLAGVAVCLSGGDIADLVPVSSEPRVQKWRRWRHEADGVGDDHLRWELTEGMHYEPLRFAPTVKTERVFFVSADFDTVVPPRHQDLLWEAFGRPTRLCVPLGHYSAALLLDHIVGAIAGHFDARCACTPCGDAATSV